MSTTISMEAGLAACKSRLGELTYENVLLRATVDEQTATIERLQEELQQALAAAPPDGEAPGGDEPGNGRHAAPETATASGAGTASR